MKLLNIIKNKNESRKIAVITNILGSYSSVLVSIVNGIVLIPIYLKFFGTNLYGAWIATAGLISMMSLLEGGINQIITQKLAKSYAQKLRVSFKLIFSSGIIINIVVSILIFLLGFLLSNVFENFISLSEENSKALSISIILASIGSSLSLFQTALFSPFYAWQKVYVVSLVSVVVSVLSIIINLLFLFNGFGIISLSISILFNGFSGFCLSLILVKKEMEIRYGKKWIIIHKAHIILILKKSTPLYLNKIITTISSNIEPILIVSFVNPSSVVIYNITNKLISISSSLISPIAGSMIGSASHLFSKRNNEKHITIINSLIVIQTVVTVIVLIILSGINQNFVYLWVGEKFYGGNVLTILFSFQVLVQTRFSLFSSLIQSSGDFKTTSLSEMFVSLIKILLSLLILKFSTISFLPLATIGSLIYFTFLYYPRYLSKYLQEKNIQYCGFEFIAIGILLIITMSSLPKIFYNWLGLFIETTAIFFVITLVIYIFFKEIRKIVIYTVQSIFNN